MLAMKICLYAFFPHFQLNMDEFVFYWFCCQFFDSTSFQILLYCDTHSFVSETLNGIV